MLYEIYNRMPKLLKNIVDIIYLLIPNSIKYGKEYREYYMQLCKQEKLSIREKEKYLVEQLRHILIYSYENTEYYYNLFKKIEFNPYKFNNLNQLEQIPLLNKDMVIVNIDKLIAYPFKNDKRKMIKITTGGTSGQQMTFFEQKKYSQVREMAYFDYLYEKVGYRIGIKMAVLRNNVLNKDKLWQWDYKNRKLLIDPYHLTDENIKKIIDKLNREKILYFHTYPSAICSICDYIRRTQYGLNYIPKAVLASSENLYDGQRELVEKYLGCKLYIHYGHSEKGCVAGWSLTSEHYYIEETYGYCELVNQGKVVDWLDSTTKGEIVTTGFNNYAMPLIRYSTGDYATYAQNGEVCNYRALGKIEGRWRQEMFFTRKRNTVSLTAINMHSDIFDNVEKYQFYQEDYGICYINIIKREAYSDDDEKKILKALQEKMGDDLQIYVNYVDSVIKTKSGKYKYLIQKIV